MFGKANIEIFIEEMYQCIYNKNYKEIEGVINEFCEDNDISLDEIKLSVKMEQEIEGY